MRIEEFRDIPGYPYYEISNFGRVKAKARIQIVYRSSGPYTRMKKELILRQGTDTDGYRYVTLCDELKCTSRKVHRLVLLTFKADSNLEVNHKDGDKSNNNIENLEYCTHSENHIHLRKVLKKLIGESHWTKKRSSLCG